MSSEVKAGDAVLVPGVYVKPSGSSLRTWDVVEVIEARSSDVESGQILCLDRPNSLLSLEALRDVLRRLEWSARTSADVPICPECYHAQEGISIPDEAGRIARWPGFHDPDCELARVLSTLDEMAPKGEAL